MPLVLAGSTSGSATIQATDAATVTLTLPATSGTLSVSGGSPSFATLTVTGDASISGLTVGKGGGAISLNTVVGAGALAATNTGFGQCSAFGFQVLNANTSGAYNTGVGLQALLSNTTGSSNIAIGGASLRTNTTGENNTGVGFQALNANTVAGYNTAVGYQSLYFANRTADVNAFNTAIGYQSGYNVTTGQGNAFIGNGAGSQMTTGSNNVIVGGYTGNNGSVDMRTLSNYLMLSNGAGSARLVSDNNGAWQSTSAVGDGVLYPAVFCRAWVNFNGTGTVSIRGSANVSSITDIGTGKYRVNFTNAMPDANYGANVSVSSMPTVSDANLVSTDADGGSRVNPTTTTFNLTTFNAQFNALDMDFIRVSIFR